MGFRARLIALSVLGLLLGIYWWQTGSGPYRWLAQWEVVNWGNTFPVVNAIVVTGLGVILVPLLGIVLLFPVLTVCASFMRQYSVLPFTLVPPGEAGAMVVRFTESTVQKAGKRTVPDDRFVLMARERDWQKVLVNLTHINHLPMSFTGKLVGLHKELTKEKNGKLILCNLDPLIAEVFRITSLGRVFLIAPDEIEGMKMFLPCDDR